MAFDPNPKKAFRSPSQRLALAQDVLAAPANTQETNWVEWKAGVDLTEAKWKFNLGKQILGSRNRDPHKAATVADGCGFVLFGVAPQDLTGIAAHDAADLESWLRPYVGTDGPDWDAHYVEVQGKDVLVVTIEPPRMGDPIFTLRKAFNNFHEGTVFIRRFGKVEQANTQEMGMLSRRLLGAGTELDLGLALSETVELFAIDLGDVAVEDWIESERAFFLGPVERQSGRDLQISAAYEGRSVDKYKEEVAIYLTEARNEVHHRAHRAAIEREFGLVKFAVSNNTEHNFGGVRVELVIEGTAHAYFDQDDAEPTGGWAHQPREWGTGRRLVTEFPLRGAAHANSVHNRENGTEIHFASVDLRPNRTSELTPVHIFVGAEYAGESLTARWAATSDQLSGESAGTIVLPISQDVLSAEKLLAAERS